MRVAGENLLINVNFVFSYDENEIMIFFPHFFIVSYKGVLLVGMLNFTFEKKSLQSTLIISLSVL